jgi:4-amino-4-deoxy-L-arabinose transferase-like glycosyltransferase
VEIRDINVFLITAPWFILAEIYSPRFLKYFFVNENFLRFISPNYGDLYGSGHKKPIGTIWLYLVGGFAPWSFLLPYLLWSSKSKNINMFIKTDMLNVRYVFWWSIGVAIMFTPAKQVSFAYVLPSLPSLSILTAYLIYNLTLSTK